MNNTTRVALDWCKEHYPNHRASVAEEEFGDVVVIYLHNLDHSFLTGCKVVYYNSWYPGEFNVYDLKPVEE